jgi:hypothetical protein
MSSLDGAAVKRTYALRVSPTWRVSVWLFRLNARADSLSQKTQWRIVMQLPLYFIENWIVTIEYLMKICHESL